MAWVLKYSRAKPSGSVAAHNSCGKRCLWAAPHMQHRKDPRTPELDFCLNARHQVTVKQGNKVQLQSLFTHTILNAFLTFREHSSTQTSRRKLISLTKTRQKQFLRKNHVVWLNGRHQGTSKQANKVSLQSLFTHTILNGFLTFRGAP